MAKNDVVIKIDGDSSGLEKAIEASEDAVKNLSKTNQTAVSQLDKFTGGMATSFVQAKAGITQLIKGLNLTKVAIIGTGIGALVVVIGSLVSYFTKTKKGAELLEQATAGLGAVMGVLTDTLSSLGEFFVSVFTEPKKTITELGDTLKTFVMDKIDQLLDGLGLLGSAIKKAFSGDLSGALDDAKEGFGKVADSALSLNPITGVGYNIAKGFGAAASAAEEAAKKAIELKEAEQALADAQRETMVETARQRAEIKQLNLIAEDTTRSVADRIQAAERAGQIERELFERRKAEAEEALRIRREQNALSKSSAEDLQAEAELEAEVYNLQAESLELQTTLQNKLNTLRAEGVRMDEEAAAKRAEEAEKRAAETQAEIDRINAENAERIAKEQELQEELNRIDETATERAIREAEEEYERRLLLAVENAELQKQVEQQYLDDIAAIQEQARQEKKAADDKARAEKNAADDAQAQKDKQREKELQDAKRQMQAHVFSSLNALAELFNNGDEKRARKSFQLSKTLGISEATIKTYQAVADALAKDAVPGVPGSRFAAAAAAGLAGAAQIAGIARQKFSGGGASVPSVSTPNLGNPSAANTGAPSFQIPNQDAFRSYVLASDVNTAQQASQKVKDQSLLLG